MDERTSRSRHPDSMRRAFLWALLPIVALILTAPPFSGAQVTTNITSSGLNTQISQVGNSYNITGGTRPANGPNLFHSFGDFSVGAGDIGNFLNTPVNGSLPVTSNILSRVTGGNISNIYGTIQTTDFGNANLFLVNPSGFVFGPNGSVNVGGSVSFTTAQYLRLFDGVSSANFYANPANDGLANSILVVDPVVNFGFLSSAAPAAYGFLTAPDPNVAITVQGSALSVPSGSSISLIGGKVVIQGATLPDGTIQRAQLSAPNGRIQLTSAASTGEFDVATLQPLPNADGTSFPSFGSISLESGSNIDVSGVGTVFIKGGQLVIDVSDATLKTSETSAPANTISLSPGGAIVTSTSGTEPGADMRITVESLLVDGTVLGTIQSGDGPGGSININATTVGLTNGASILSSTGLDFITGASVGFGNGGNVTVQGLGGPGSPADSVALSNGSTIQTLTLGPGRAGNVQLTAGTLAMESFSSILTGSLDGAGAGGDVMLNVGTVSLNDGSSIQSFGQSFTPGAGRGGNVTIQGLQGAEFGAAESVTLSGGSGLLTQSSGSNDGGRVAITSKSLTMDGAGTTVNSSADGVGRGGDIVLSVGQASLSGGATIITQTNSADLNAVAGGTVTLQGLQGPGSMADSVVLSGFGSGIVSETFGTGRSGDVAVHAKTVSLTDGAVIQAGTPSTTAAGGNVTIDAGSVGISGGSHISSQARNLNAGQVAITANQLNLDNGSIDTSTSSEIGGRGGDVVVHGGTVSLTNGASITSQSEGFFSTGRAGDITITAESLKLANLAEITSRSAGAGDAGSITIQSGSIVAMNNSVMTAEANQASGGQITITAPEMVRLTNSQIRTSVAGNATDTAGANVTIDPQFVILQNSAIIVQSFAGFGGNISITAGVFLVDPNSVVISSGSQRFSVPNSPLGGSLSPMSQQFSSAAALLLAERCAADPTGQFSSFIQTGREGVPQIPGALSPSPLSFLETLTSSSLGSPSPNVAAARLGLGSVRFDDATRFPSACRS